MKRALPISLLLLAAACGVDNGTSVEVDGRAAPEVAGLDADANRPIWEVDLSVPTALVMGNEGSGLHRLVKQKCDFLVSLPIRSNMD